MAKIEIKSPNGAKMYEVLDDLVTIGADNKNHIRLKDPSAPAFAARLLRSAQGWRIEPAEQGRKFMLNGLTVGAADLEPGDVVKIDSIELVFHSGDGSAPAPTKAAEPASAVAAPAPIVARRSAAQAPTRAPTGQGGGGNARSGARGGARSRGGSDGDDQRGARDPRAPRATVSNKIGLYTIIGTIALAVVFLGYQFFQSSVFASDPAELVAKAKQYLRGADFETCDKILLELDRRNPDASIRGEMDRIRAGIAAAKQMSELQPHLSRASDEHSILFNFVQTYLSKEVVKREHCREFIRLANTWIDKYRKLSDQVPDFAESQFKQVGDWVAKFKPTAKVEEPDAWEDVNFRADRMTRLTPNKRWREAVQAIDDFLAKNGKHEAAEAMKRSRLNQAENWLSDKLQSADNLIAKKDVDVLKDYIELFQFEIETGGLVTWRPKLEAKLEQMKAVREKK